MKKESVYIPDISAIETNILSRLISDNKVHGKILIHKAILSEFEKKAISGDDLGLKALKKLREIANEKGIEIEFVDNNEKEIDFKSAIRELALKKDGYLISCDPITLKVAEAMGIKVLFELPETKLKLEEFFTENVMSVHLKEGVIPRVKRGIPGKWVFEQIGEKEITREELESIIANILEKVQVSQTGSGFVEINKGGTMIVQLNDIRIVITRPPFSDGLELTAVKPIAKLSLEDYGLPIKLIERFEKQAEGILIAGAPGMGKTTLAQALAEFYRNKGKIVKTVESPRDLQLPLDITQYSKSAATSSEIHDVLLLSRPDYTIFDELRNDEDFNIFMDLRLAGIGAIGVVHATSPIDAIQRFANRAELGIIPSIIDTVVFMNMGIVTKVYTIETTVKIPHGLKKYDLARPVVVVKDFLSGIPEYELYVFGEKSFVVPVKDKEKEKVPRIKFFIEKTIEKYIPDYEVEVKEDIVTIYIPPEYFSIFSKKIKKKLEKIRKRYEIAFIDVKPIQ
ncbi:MAG: ATPase, T2SS/T4P/T4SS family [Nitrososphaerota archaeon]